MQAASVDHADKRLGDRVKCGREDSADNGNQHRAHKYRQAVLPAVSGRKSHHWNREQKDKSLFQHSARLAVEKEQYTENCDQQSSEGQFLSIFIHALQPYPLFLISIFLFLSFTSIFLFFNQSVKACLLFLYYNLQLSI